MSLLIKNALVVNASGEANAPVDILMDGGKIIEISAAIQREGCQVIDAKGKKVLPGLIDLHVHLREPGREDKETIAKLNAAFEEVKAASGPFFGGAVPKGLIGGLRDGDAEKDDEAYEGAFFINANSVQKPGVVDADLNPIIDPDEFYSGCFGRASLTFYPYNSNGSKGIAGLGNLQKLEDGERLGGGSSAATDFAV